METNPLETRNGNFAIEYNNKFFFISGDMKRVLREISEEEFDHLCECIEPSPEKSLTIPGELVKKLDKEVSFIEDASMLEYFRNSALVAVYPFLSLDAGPISVEKLSENRNVLLSNPCNSSYDSCAWSGYDWTTIKFYNKKKELVGDQRNASETKFASNSDTDSSEPGETMVESIARLGIADSVTYIGVSHKDNGSYNDATVCKWQQVYLVDLPMAELIAEIQAAAEASVAAVVS